jgi:molecular chaperone DnaK (HSP70)
MSEEARLEEINSPYVLGIDLGTSTSIVSVYKAGRTDVLPVVGERVTPSVVSYRENAEALVGTQAKRRALIDPDNTVVSIKREMGKSDYQREVLGKPIKPEEVSALILEHLKNGAQEQLGGNIRDVIVTIPANFDNNQRQATLEAGRLAGLNVLRLLEEPVAAAIAYGFRSQKDQTILVYDLGGGTFDVCILKVESTTDGPADFKVLGKAGIAKLGGDDFDDALMKLLANEIVKAGGPDVLDLRKDQGINKKKLRAACQVLKECAEAAKIELSDADKTEVNAPNLIKNETGQDFHLSVEITRAQFEEAIKPLIEQSGECIKQALTEANLSIDDVDRIILVGGSTRVPCVRKLVKEMFNKDPYGDIDPGTAVSQGAAIFGAAVLAPDDKQVVTLLTTTSHYLGIETTGQRFNAILDKATPVPAVNTKPYTTTFDNQTELRIAIFQFPEKVEYIDMKAPGSACLGEFFLGPLDPAPKGTLAIDVKFSIDPNGIIKVTAEAKGRGMTKEIDVRIQN